LEDLTVNVKAVEKAMEPIKKKNLEQIEDGKKYN